MLAELRQEVVGRHTRLAGHGLHLILPENRLQLMRWNWLIGTVTNPGLNKMAQSSLLKAGEQSPKSSSRAAGLVATCAKHVHQHTLQGRAADAREAAE